MGLFGSGNEDSREQRLAKEANGESVTVERLTAVKRGFGKGTDYLADSSVLDWLRESEQPHFVFPSDRRGGHELTRERGDDLAPNGSYRTIVVVTDERVLILVGDDTGDRPHTIEYDSVTDVRCDTADSATGVSTLGIATGEEVSYFQSTYFDSELLDAAKYLVAKSDQADETVRREFEAPKSEAEKAKAELEKATERVEQRLDKAAKTPANDGPQPVYEGRGGKVRIEGNTNQRVNCGGVEVYEDEIRVQKKGMINRSWITIPIGEIQSIDDTVFGKVSIVTDANDYKISGCSISGQLVQFVNKRLSEDSSDSRDAPTSTADELEKFANLHERGVISDEEFEEKKRELL